MKIQLGKAIYFSLVQSMILYAAISVALGVSVFVLYRQNVMLSLFILIVLTIAVPCLLFLDITKRINTEQKLMQSTEKLRGKNLEMMEHEARLVEALSQLRRLHLDLKSAHSRLIQAEKFATIGKLAGMISHEFRNELGVMRNATYFLKLKLKNADEKIKRNLDILEERIQETDRIIENIMTFAKTHEPQLAPSKLSELIYASIGKVKIPENIQIRTEMEKGLPQIMADEIQLSRAFVNLVLNAVQALEGRAHGGGKGGGEILVKANCENDYIKIQIADNGPGIEEAAKEHLFEPLFTTKARGGGLGLATTQLLIEGHGGTIDIESEWGKGTSVFIRLPFIFEEGQYRNVAA